MTFGHQHEYCTSFNCRFRAKLRASTKSFFKPTWSASIFPPRVVRRTKAVRQVFPCRCQFSLFKLIESGTAKRTRKNRMALAPAFAQYPSHAGPCFIRRIVRHGPSLRTTADVNGIEAFPRRGGGQPKQNKGNQTQDPTKMVKISQTGANVAKCYWSVAGLFPQMLPVKSLIIKVCFRVSPFPDYTIIFIK